MLSVLIGSVKLEQSTGHFYMQRGHELIQCAIECSHLRITTLRFSKREILYSFSNHNPLSPNVRNMLWLQTTTCHLRLSRGILRKVFMAVSVLDSLVRLRDRKRLGTRLAIDDILSSAVDSEVGLFVHDGSGLRISAGAAETMR